VSVPEGAASTTFYETIANHDRVIDGIIEGSELLSWTINGHEEDGSTFSLAVTDRFASDYDITFAAAWDLADFVYSLSAIKGVTIDDVTMDSAVDDDNSTWTVSRLEQRVGGDWQKVGKGAPVVAKAGKTAVLRAVLTGASGSRTVPVSMKIPDEAQGMVGRMQVLGGSYVWSNLQYPRSVAQAEKFVDTMVRNDEVQATMSFFKRRGEITTTKVTDPLDKVVDGRKRVGRE
jgi:hypothetical protein